MVNEMFICYNDNMKIETTYKFKGRDFLKNIRDYTNGFRTLNEMNNFQDIINKQHLPYELESISMSENIFTILKNMLLFNLIYIKYDTDHKLTDINQILESKVINNTFIKLVDTSNISGLETIIDESNKALTTRKVYFKHYHTVFYYTNPTEENNLTIAKVLNLPINSHPVYNLSKIKFSLDRIRRV